MNGKWGWVGCVRSKCTALSTDNNQMVHVEGRIKNDTAAGTGAGGVGGSKKTEKERINLPVSQLRKMFGKT